MPILPIKIRPGVNTTFTPTLNEAGWSDSNNIRFVGGLPQKIGGWTKFWPFSLGSAIRAMFDWQDFDGNDRLAIGSQSTLGVITDGDLTDLTPQTLTSDFTPDFATTNASPTVTVDDPNISTVTTYDAVYFNTPIAVGGLILTGMYPISLVTGATTYEIVASSNATSTATGGAVPSFATTSGSTTITVTLTAHGLSVGSRVVFDIETTVGGVDILGTYDVITVPTANTFTITASTTASSTTSASMNGGDAQLLYYITLGPPPVGAGYGLSTYGTGTYGLGSASSAQVGDPITATNYTLDTWGQTLLACPEGGAIYYWNPDGGFSTMAAITTDNAPVHNAGIFVAQPAQILVAYGSTTRTSSGNIGAFQDPLLIRWSDQDNYLIWSVDTTNQAGSVRIPRGSRIVSGIQGPNQALIWTDAGIWSMQYVGQPLVFSTNEIGTGCGLIAQYARAVIQDRVFWMGSNNFYTLGNGGVQTIECSVWDDVFQDLDTANQSKCWAWPVANFFEVWFFYPSLQDGTGECSRYVKMNLSGIWDKGQMPRSSGLDVTVFGYPLAATSGGIIYQHEDGNDGDGSPIDAYVETGDVMIADGQNCMFVDQVRPDMKYEKVGETTPASLSITITAENDLTGEVMTSGAMSYTETTTYLTTRVRGHRLRARLASADLGSWWRLGLMRYRGAQDGRL